MLFLFNLRATTYKISDIVQALRDLTHIFNLLITHEANNVAQALLKYGNFDIIQQFI